jgi:hypothetical protein
MPPHSAHSHLASHLASPLAIYDTDFAPNVGCLASPHHFLSPRTVEQLGEQLTGLDSATLRVSMPSTRHTPREDGEEAAAACLSARMQHAHTDPGSRLSARSGGSARSAAGSCSVADRLSGRSSSSALSGGSESVARAVYEAIGGLATLAAAAPPGRGKRSRGEQSGGDEIAEEGYEGAGVAERRKPIGMANLHVPNSNNSADPPSAAGSASAGRPSFSGHPSPRSCVIPVSGGSSGSGGSYGSWGSAVFSSSGIGSGGRSSQPTSARSVELAALVSPALGVLGCTLGTMSPKVACASPSKLSRADVENTSPHRSPQGRRAPSVGGQPTAQTGVVAC